MADHNPRMTRPPIGDMLPLEFAPTASRLPERIVAMRPTEGGGPFDDPAYFFEPWWPGIRAFVLVEDGAVRLRAEALGDPTAAFPELAGVAELVRRDGVVLDTTLMVLDARGRPSRTLLERRLRGETVRLGGRARVRGGARGPGDETASSGESASGGGGQPRRGPGSRGSAAIVASDLLYLEGESLAARPFGERRGELAALLRPSSWCLAGRGFVGDGTTVATALGALGFRALSARRLDARLRPGNARDAWYRVPVVAAPRELPPFLAVLRRLPL
jgi:bifunctional non-homologous end joining protein LigD